jgi:hypothetical protein
VSCTLFPCENWFPFERNILYLSGFSIVRNITSVQNTSIQVKGRSIESLGRKPSMLEAGGCSTLFPWENGICLWKEYLGSESIMKRENYSLDEKCSLQTKWRNTCIIWHSTMCIKDKSDWHIVSLWALSYILKGILPTSQGFQVWGTSTLCKIAPFKWM